MSLAVDKVSKRYGTIWALKDVSFEVEGGSVIGLFGASGSGKSALLKVIAGSVKHNGGSISLDGNDITGDMFPGWCLLLAPVLEALLWPLVTLLLLAPQRRAPDPDQNRPL